MAEPVDPRILVARLDKTVSPTGVERPTPAKETAALRPGEPTFAESLERATARLVDAETRIPDPSTARNSTDVDSLYQQLGALHEMTMDAHLIIAQLGQQIVRPEETTDQQNPPAEQE